MSAIVVTDKGEDWFTNSYTWLTILERAFDALPPELHDEYSGYANSGDRSSRTHLELLASMLRAMVDA